MDKLILAIDCGTQSTRALIFDSEGHLLDKKKVEYPSSYFSDEPGYAEQKAEVYWDSLKTAAQDLAARRPELMQRVAGVGITAQRDSLICLDKNGVPLRPAILWLDVRKAKPCYRPGFLMKGVLSLVGMSEGVMRTQEEGKANWIMQQEPEIWEKTYKLVQVSGYLTQKLSGEFMDSIAAQIGHLPFDYKKQEWYTSNSVNRKMFPVPLEKLPCLVKPGEKIGTVSQQASELTGIPAGIPVIAAGSDKGCETIGMGVLSQTMASLSFGTTATVQTTSPRYFEPIPFMPAYPACIPGYYNPEVEIFRGYWMITWFKNQFAYEEVVEAHRRGIAPEVMLDELLKKTPAGGHGLVMQPYWTPMLKMPSAKGAIIGFGDVHDRAYLYRTIIEGLAYGLKDGLSAIEHYGKVKATEVAVSGGASQSDEICRTTANVFNLPLVRGETYETSGLGAAMVVAAGLGFYSSVEEAARAMSRRSQCFMPDAERSALYKELYERVYKKMYGALGPLYEEIRDITNYPEKSVKW